MCRGFWCAVKLDRGAVRLTVDVGDGDRGSDLVQIGGEQDQSGDEAAERLVGTPKITSDKAFLVSWIASR